MIRDGALLDEVLNVIHRNRKTKSECKWNRTFRLSGTRDSIRLKIDDGKMVGYGLPTECECSGIANYHTLVWHGGKEPVAMVVPSHGWRRIK